LRSNDEVTGCNGTFDHDSFHNHINAMPELAQGRWEIEQLSQLLDDDFPDKPDQLSFFSGSDHPDNTDFAPVPQVSIDYISLHLIWRIFF
jgi:hypothetical protein